LFYFSLVRRDLGNHKLNIAFYFIKYLFSSFSSVTTSPLPDTQFIDGAANILQPYLYSTADWAIRWRLSCCWFHLNWNLLSNPCLQEILVSMCFLCFVFNATNDLFSLTIPSCNMLINSNFRNSNILFQSNSKYQIQYSSCYTD